MNLQSLSIAALISLSTLSAFSESLELKDIKTCKTTLSIPDSKNVLKVTVTFSQFGSNYQAQLTDHSSEFGANSSTFPAVVMNETVREGLNGDSLSEVESLNEAEKFISHAIMLETNPVFKGAFKSGIDLAAVRSATVFLVKEPGVNIGATAVIESRDSSGKVLGSFLGGLLIGACE